MDDFKTATITEKLNFIQHELKVKKSNVNSFAKFNYRTLDDIFENVKPLLDKTGCVITISDELVDKNNGTYIKASVELSDGNDSISVDAFARESVGKKGMDDPQMTGTASTYARKYACNGLFAIDDVADADSMDNTYTITENQKARYEELLNSGAYEGKKSDINKWWKGLTTKEQADAGLLHMENNVNKYKKGL